jgi:hypothetical protein
MSPSSRRDGPPDVEVVERRINRLTPFRRIAAHVSGLPAFFVTVPMAPPRFMVDYGFVDTVTQHSEAHTILQPPPLTNQYAALPSPHVERPRTMG